MSLLRAVLVRFWGRVERIAVDDLDSLAAARWIVGLSLLAYLVPNYQSAAVMPMGMLRPPFASLTYWFPLIPGRVPTLALELIHCAALLAVTVGFRARIAGRVFLIASMTGLSFCYAFGRINHDIFPHFALWLMGEAGWGSALALRPDPPASQRSSRRAQVGLASILVVGMASAGIPKAVYWLDFDLDTSGVGAWMLAQRIWSDFDALLLPHLHRTPPWLLEAMDVWPVFMELSGLVVLFLGRRLWLAWLSMVAAFHGATTIALNVFFLSNAIAYLAFLGPEPGTRSIRLWITAHRTPLTAFATLIAGIAAAHRLLWPSLDFWPYYPSPAHPLNYLVNVVGCLVAFGLLTGSAIGARSATRRLL